MMLFNLDTMTTAITAGILAGFGWYWGNTIAHIIHMTYTRYRKKITQTKWGEIIPMRKQTTAVEKKETNK